MATLAALAVGSGGCAHGGTASPDGAPPAVDAFVPPIDAPPAVDAPAPIDAPPAVDGSVLPAGASPLLLSELVLQPSVAEFIEIVNTSNTAVDLSSYYLSDNGNYWQLPAKVPAVETGDFIAKFPAGAMIPAHGTITIALDSAPNFTSTYPVATYPTAHADYSIADATMTIITQSAPASLTNTGEVVILFQWDGQSDLVTDIDIMIAGAPSMGNTIVPKSGMAQDGPDPLTATTAYRTDADTLAGQMLAPLSLKSTKRIALEAGHETQAGIGNGQSGDDETSEVTSVTWDTTYSAPTPGAVPAALLQ